MPSIRRNLHDILARVNFPLYTIQMLTNRHIIVGGGGGSSKTGVANGFEIFELSHDGTKFVVEEMTRHETGPSVVMNCSVFTDDRHSYVVAGQENHCQLYNVKSVLVMENVETLGNDVVNRKKTQNNNTKGRKKLKYVLQNNDSVQTDFIGNEPLLRIVRIHPKGKILATGGTDGFIKLWKFPSLQLTFTLKGHKKEIDDIDFSPHDNFLITIAKDGVAILWNWTNGKEIRKLSWTQPEGSRYLYKRSRFGVRENVKESNLFMLANPTGPAKKQKSYLQLWIPEEGSLKSSYDYDESLSALAVRDDGRFVAVGTMFSGSVSIHIAFSLQRVLFVKGAHSMFVTGLEFLPVAKNNHIANSVAEAAVLSISVDNHICIHTLEYRRTIPALLGIFLIILTLFFTFAFCSYLGL